MQSIQGKMTESLSVSSVAEGVQRGLCLGEFLITLAVSDLPPHKLQLKLITPITPLRNINGYRNGTRLRVCQLFRNCIIAEILTGAFHGTSVGIPRIHLTASEMVSPSQLRRRLSTGQVSFAMTTNEAQGEAVHHLGDYLLTSLADSITLRYRD